MGQGVGAQAGVEKISDYMEALRFLYWVFDLSVHEDWIGARNLLLPQRSPLSSPGHHLRRSRGGPYTRGPPSPEAFDVPLWRREGKGRIFQLEGQPVVYCYVPDMVGPLPGAREPGSRQSLATSYQIVLADANVFDNPNLSSTRPPVYISDLLPN